MAFENRRWLVLPTAKITEIDFDQVLEPDGSSLRRSIDGEKIFVKYEVNVVEETYTEKHTNIETGDEVVSTINAGVYGRPDVYSTDYTEYNHADMLDLLATNEWSTQEDI